MIRTILTFLQNGSYHIDVTCLEPDCQEVDGMAKPVTAVRDCVLTFCETSRFFWTRKSGRLEPCLWRQNQVFSTQTWPFPNSDKEVCLCLNLSWPLRSHLWEVRIFVSHSQLIKWRRLRTVGQVGCYLKTSFLGELGMALMCVYHI